MTPKTKTLFVRLVSIAVLVLVVSLILTVALHELRAPITEPPRDAGTIFWNTLMGLSFVTASTVACCYFTATAVTGRCDPYAA